MRRIVLPLAAALAVTAAAPASADHDKGGTKSYVSSEPITKLTKAQALDMFLFDLGERAGDKFEKAQKVKCKVKKRKATCSYRAVSKLGESLGVDSGFCVKNGKLKLKADRKRFTVKQKAKDC